MGKLSCYVLNGVLYEEGLHNYFGMSRSGWFKMPYSTYEKLRLHLMYTFEDRFDQGLDIQDLIWYLETVNKGYPFMLKVLKKIAEYSFENYTPNTVSKSMLIYLMGIDPRNINKRKQMFNKRFYCKKFKKFIKSFEQAVEKDIKQFKGISI